MFERYYDEIQKAQAIGGIPDPTIRTRQVIPNLKAQRQELQLRIDKIDRLLSLLEKNPEMVQVLDLSRELL